MMWATRGCTECSGRRLGRPPSQRGLLLFHVNWLHFWKVDISMYIISKYIYILKYYTIQLFGLYSILYLYTDIYTNIYIYMYMYMYYMIYIFYWLYLYIYIYWLYISYSLYLNSILYYINLYHIIAFPAVAMSILFCTEPGAGEGWEGSEMEANGASSQDYPTHFKWEMISI